MGEPVIRRLELKDRDAANLFFDQMAYDAKFFFNRNDGNRKGMMRFFDGLDPESTLRWGAFDGDEMVGYTFLWDCNTGVPWFGIAVAESLRGKHFGEKLINTCKDWCRENGKGGILLTTHRSNFRAQGLYERCGFVRLGVHMADDEYLYLFRF